MKYSVLVSLTGILILFSGCQSEKEKSTIENACIKYGHNSVSENMLGDICSCADVNISNGFVIVRTFSYLDNSPKSIGELQDYVKIRPLGN